MARTNEIMEHYWEIKTLGGAIPKPIKTIVSTGDPQIEAKDQMSPQISLYLSDLPSRARILDVGAGDKLLEDAIRIRGLSHEYRSMDTAVRSDCIYDFQSPDEVEGVFDLVVMQEVIEHMPMEVGFEYLKKACGWLDKYGWIAVSTPNVGRPMQFFTADFSHVSHWPLHDLLGVLRVAGFNGHAEIRMIEIKDPMITLTQRIRRAVTRLGFAALGFPFAHGILIKIRKNNPPTEAKSLLVHENHDSSTEQAQCI